MNNRTDYTLMKQILNCRKCRDSGNLRRYVPDKYPPVFCFGEPADKEVFVIGINPSKAEYDSGYLKKDVEKALESQITYFERREYKYFNEIARFFKDNEIEAKLEIADNLWKKVGYLDLVKCVTVKEKEQWSALPPSKKKKIIENCRNLLEQQLTLYQPKLIIAYGKDVGDWFGVKDFYEEAFNFISQPKKLRFVYQAIYIPQRQGNHSRPEVNEVKAKLREALKI